MKHISMNKMRSGKKTWLYALIVCSTCLLANVPSAFAGKEGVFISNDTYFTLENAAFSAGVNSSAMRFILKMHNGSQSDIDFNNYGVRIVDDQGNRFPAKLTSKQTARVTPGHDQEFRFYSEVASGVTPHQLKVNLYTWDGSQFASSTSLGDLSVSAAVPSETEASNQSIISLHDIDASYSQEAFVSFRLGSSYQAAESGSSYLYTDLYVQNEGTSSVQLPSSLYLRLKDADFNMYTGSIMGGSSSSLLPNKVTKLSLRTSIPDTFDADQFTLETIYENSSEERILGSLPLAGTSILSPIGKEQPYALYGTDNGMTISAEKAIAVKQADGCLVQTTVKIRNNGSNIVTLPSLSAAYLFGTESINASGQDQSVQSGFLSPQQTATYRYAVVLPEGIDPKAAKLALIEQKTATASTTTANSTSSTSSTSTNTSKSSWSDKSPVMLVPLNDIEQSYSFIGQAQPYQLAAPISFAPNGLIDKNIEISLVELHMHENSDFGYKTAIAKYKLTNRGSSTLSLPDLGTELINGQGLAFTGERQTR